MVSACIRWISNNHLHPLLPLPQQVACLHTLNSLGMCECCILAEPMRAALTWPVQIVLHLVRGGGTGVAHNIHLQTSFLRTLPHQIVSQGLTPRFCVGPWDATCCGRVCLCYALRWVLCLNGHARAYIGMHIDSACAPNSDMGQAQLLIARSALSIGRVDKPGEVLQNCGLLHLHMAAALYRNMLFGNGVKSLNGDCLHGATRFGPWSLWPPVRIA
jgi:hypothetical protein